MTNLITKHYAVGHDYVYTWYVDGTPAYEPRKVMHVFVYVAGPYNTNNKLHTFHKCKRCWSMCEEGRKTLVSAKRTKQIEKICKQLGVKPEITKKEW